MIAIALINNPTVLIADEPTSALDAATTSNIRTYHYSMCAQRDMALLLISHDLRLVAEYCESCYGHVSRGSKWMNLRQKHYLATHPSTTRLLWTCRPNASTYGTRLPVLDGNTEF